jgi:hypothetical protein
MGLTGKAADQNVNWGETGGTNTSGAITPSESSTACSSPGGLLSPPCACGRIARALFLLRVCGVGQSAVDFSDIGIPPHIGPMLREHRATPWINFHLPPNLEPCPLKPEVKAPDAGEQRSDRQGLPHASLLGAKVAAGSPRRNPRGVITIGVMRVASPTFYLPYDNLTVFKICIISLLYVLSPDGGQRGYRYPRLSCPDKVELSGQVVRLILIQTSSTMTTH